MTEKINSFLISWDLRSEKRLVLVVANFIVEALGLPKEQKTSPQNKGPKKKQTKNKQKKKTKNQTKLNMHVLREKKTKKKTKKKKKKKKSKDHTHPSRFNRQRNRWDTKAVLSVLFTKAYCPVRSLRLTLGNIRGEGGRLGNRVVLVGFR